jgi:hypothetical protein
MDKGIAVSTVLYLVIAVIILILFMPILIRSAGAVWNQFLTSLGLAAPPTALEQAIKCAYYRCVEGCVHSTKVTEEIEWKENGRIVKCNDFCDAPYKAGAYEGGEDEVKVCGWNAMQYPVEIKVENDTQITHDFWTGLIKESIGDNPAGWSPLIGMGECGEDMGAADYLVFDGNTKCSYDGKAVPSSCEVKKGEYFIWAKRRGLPWPLSGERVHEYVCSNRTYILLQLDGSPVQEEFEVKNYRIAIQSQTKKLDYSLEITKIDDSTKSVSFRIKNETFSEEKTLTASSPDYSLPTVEGYILVKLSAFKDQKVILALVYSSTGQPISPPSDCSSYTKKEDCPALCWWCEKCSGLMVNRWGEGKCVQPGTDCGYHCDYPTSVCGAECNNVWECGRGAIACEKCYCVRMAVG